jgi:ssRNA-specific RNase YbeY (16S rRNA maturation enzyme)
VEESQKTPNDTVFIKVHDPEHPQVSITLSCSNLAEYCSAPRQGETFEVSVLPVSDKQAYRHYVTWHLRNNANNTINFALKEYKDADGSTYRGDYAHLAGQLVGKGRDIVFN